MTPRRRRLQRLPSETKAAAEAARLAGSRSEALKAAATEAEAEKSAILAAARDDAEKLRTAAKADIERARQGEAAAVADRASRLAVDIAAKLLDRLPDEARIEGFLDGLADGLAALPEATRAGVGVERRSAPPESGAFADRSREESLPDAARKGAGASDRNPGRNRSRSHRRARNRNAPCDRPQQLPGRSRPHCRGVDAP